MRPWFALMIMTSGIGLAGYLLPAPAGAVQAKDAPGKLKNGDFRVKGKLTKDDPKDRVRKNSAHRSHEVHLQEGKEYTIDLVSDDFDAFLRLEGAEGAELATDDDSGGELNARIVFRAPKDGKYRIIATTFSGGMGQYTLGVRETILTELKAGVFTVENTLTTSDLKLKSRYYKVYPIKLTAGKTYTFDLESNDFDAFLRLEDSRGKQLAEDDDGGGDQNARIVHKAAKDDVCRVIVTSFEPGEAGNYTFKIREK